MFHLLCTIQFLSTPSARRATGTPEMLDELGKFLSTPSARRATKRWSMTGGSSFISIHALREEGDAPWCRPQTSPSDFYPRPPRGGRQPSPASPATWIYFYPRPPRGGRRLVPPDLQRQGNNFYPRPPRGGRPPAFCGLGSALVFLSTPSARRATDDADRNIFLKIFLSTPSARRATGCDP